MVFPPANNSFAKAPPRAPGTGRYSTSKSNKQHISRTFRQKGELSYSYTTMGLEGPRRGQDRAVVAKSDGSERQCVLVGARLGPEEFDAADLRKTWSPAEHEGARRQPHG